MSDVRSARRRTQALGAEAVNARHFREAVERRLLDLREATILTKSGKNLGSPRDIELGLMRGATASAAARKRLMDSRRERISALRRLDVRTADIAAQLGLTERQVRTAEEYR